MLSTDILKYFVDNIALLATRLMLLSAWLLRGLGMPGLLLAELTTFCLSKRDKKARFP